MLTRVLIVNDFEAIGYGIDLLDLKNDVIKLPHVGIDLTAGRTEFNTISVIGARAGLGMSIAHYDPAKHLHLPMPSEGGHTDFVPYDELDLKLIEYLKKKVLTKKKTHPEFERLLSAKGMEHIFNFLATQKGYKEHDLVKEILKLEGNDKLAEIEANYHKNKTCKKTIELFMSYYARACKNLALISECYSGLFITDIITLRNIKRMEDNKKILMHFMEVFEQHDKRSDVLRKVPLYLITNKDVGLLGCGNVAVNFYNIT